MTLTIEVEPVKSVNVVSLIGRLDGVTAPELDDRIPQFTGAGRALVLDLSGLSYASSAGLRVILKLGKQAKAAKVRLVLADLTPTVKEVFDISGFMAIFEVKADRDEALAAVG